jgi:thiol-disulfide isomerase/thioredoxin
MLLAFLFFASLVNDVRGLVARNDFGAAVRLARNYQSQAGATPELAAALSWLARGSLDSRQYDEAEKYASETRKLALDLLRTRKLETDPWLSTALGASIEVHSRVLAARGELPEAVTFLREQLKAYAASPIGERIRKNLNLLDLTGKPAPPLDGKEWLSAQPAPLTALRGHPVLLFFWAHWCGDCKGEAPVLAAIMQAYGPRGLRLVAPTKLYGYVARGQDATPPVEKQYIDQVRRQYYPVLNGVPVPLSAANFLEYGTSTTPTLVLIDGTGVVRLYHPGAMTEAELRSETEKLLRK